MLGGGVLLGAVLFASGLGSFDLDGLCGDSCFAVNLDVEASSVKTGSALSGSNWGEYSVGYGTINV